MSDSAARGDRTQPPTAHRRRLAREQGQTGHSRALTSAVAVGVFTLVVAVGAARAWGQLAALAKVIFTAAPAVPGSGTAPAEVWGAWVAPAARLALRMLVWPLALMAVAALLAGALQTGANVRLAAIVPELGRLFHGQSTRRAPWRLLVVTVLASLAIIGLAASALFGVANELLRLTGLPVAAILVAMAVLAQQLMGPLAVAVLSLGVVDWLWARLDLRRESMMTQEEVRREARELEGDPRQKAERRRRAAPPDPRAETEPFGRALSETISETRSDTRSDAATHAVLVAHSLQNGTRAVVLRYQRSTDRRTGRAPVVVAKGQGERATRIVQRALALGLPIREDAALANGLLFVPEGEPVPEIFFESVARAFSDWWAGTTAGT